MRIHVYGCSWSCGIPEIDDFNCWPKELARLEPEWRIYNFAVGGSSVHFSSYCYFWSKNNIAEPVYHIFQGTSQYRWTHFPKDLDPLQYMEKHADNYWSFFPRTESIRNEINTLQIKSIPLSRLGTHYRKKLKYEKEDQWEIERYSIFEALRNNIDLAFFHRYHDSRDYKKYFDNHVMCIADVLGKEKFYDLVDDHSHHFGTEGFKWQADFMRKHIQKDCMKRTKM